MRKLIICGAGGFGGEVALCVKDINERCNSFNLLGFVDENKNLHNKEVNGLKVLGGNDFLINYPGDISVVISVNNPEKRFQVVEKLRVNKGINYPNIIHPTSIINSNLSSFGSGNIIFPYCTISFDVSMGDFNVINSYGSFGHHSKIGNFNTFNPKVSISGGVQVNDQNEFGISSSVLQYKNIGSNNVIGAHSLLLRNISDRNSYFGVPAKKLEF